MKCIECGERCRFVLCDACFDKVTELPEPEASAQSFGEAFEYGDAGGMPNVVVDGVRRFS